MKNARLDEAKARIKIAGRNINNLRYSDNKTLMSEREEELMSLLVKVKQESEKAGFKLNIQKTKIMLFGDGKQMGKQRKQWQVYFLGSKITVDADCSHENKRLLLLERKESWTIKKVEC